MGKNEQQNYTFAVQLLVLIMSNLREMTEEAWDFRTDAALAWIRRSISVTCGRGSSHSWHPFLGWSKAYPETTGYLIETLLAYAEHKQDDSLRQLALEGVEWLDSIQLPSGAFPGLLAGNTKPSVFNTGQILFAAPGQARKVYDSFGLKGTKQAVSWLLEHLEPDGAWRKHAFVPGFVPSYYTRAVWGVLYANDLLQIPEIEELMHHSLHFYAARFLPNGAVKDWGFRSGEPAFTHTIAYTLEGFWECALRLGTQDLLARTEDSLKRLLAERERAGGRTAGCYDEHWRGDYSFICIAGNCQLSLLCHKVWERTGDPKFKDAAEGFLAEILGFQRLGANKNTFGAFPGSAPFWGAYLPLRTPNWGVKFFLDAMLRIHHEVRKDR